MASGCHPKPREGPSVPNGCPPWGSVGLWGNGNMGLCGWRYLETVGNGEEVVEEDGIAVDSKQGEQPGQAGQHQHHQCCLQPRAGGGDDSVSTPGRGGSSAAHGPLCQLCSLSFVCPCPSSLTSCPSSRSPGGWHRTPWLPARGRRHRPMEQGVREGCHGARTVYVPCAP